MMASYILLIGTLYTVSIRQCTSKIFPATEFFNLSSIHNESLSEYLCHVNPEENKCCSCDPEICFEDCCIDALWNHETHFNLSAYVNEFIGKLKSGYEEYECQSIIFPLDNRHISTSLLKTTKYSKNNQHIHCNKDGYNKIQIPVFSQDSFEVYMNRECAELNDEPDSIKVNISVVCEDVHNVSNGMVFDMNLQKQMLNCIFEPIYDRNILRKDWLYFCPREISSCERKSKHFDLCKAYTAPTRGYRNVHCYNCNNNESTHLQFDRCDHTCLLGDCTIRNNKDERYTRNIWFNLIANDKEQYIIKDIVFHFPINSRGDNPKRRITGLPLRAMSKSRLHDLAANVRGNVANAKKGGGTKMTSISKIFSGKVKKDV